VPFNTPVPVLELNTTTADTAPSLTLDGLRIYFNRSSEIWTATRPNWSSPFGTATLVTELNSPNNDRDPRVSPDNLVIVFASDRPGGTGSTDIYMASRLDTSSPFGTPVQLAPLNSTVLELNPAIGMFPDEIFFMSSRPGGLGGWELYSARFTGVVGLGIAGVGSSQGLRFSDPNSAGKVYLAASALGDTPGIQIGNRNLPLNPDLLLRLSIGGLPPILTGYFGTLDQNGIGSGRIAFQGFPGFTGLKFVTAFVTLDPAAPMGIGTISNAHPTQVQ
jgi:hypothetical protein